MAPALPHAFSCGGPEMGLALAHFFRLFSCGGPEMAPALPHAFKPFGCVGPELGSALPQADNRGSVGFRRSRSRCAWS
jgi:hypothetical protein